MTVGLIESASSLAIDVLDPSTGALPPAVPEGSPDV
jgi:hypothetical protein